MSLFTCQWWRTVMCNRMGAVSLLAINETAIPVTCLQFNSLQTQLAIENRPIISTQTWSSNVYVWCFCEYTQQFCARQCSCSREQRNSTWNWACFWRWSTARLLTWWLKSPCAHFRSATTPTAPKSLGLRSKSGWLTLRNRHRRNTSQLREGRKVSLAVVVMLYVWCFCDLMHRHSVYNNVLAAVHHETHREIGGRSDKWGSDQWSGYTK